MPQTSHDWTETLQALRHRASLAGADVARLEAERRPLVLGAKTGDRAAQGKLDALSQRQHAAEREHTDLLLAAQEADRELEEARAREAADLASKRRLETMALIQERVAAAQRTDQAIDALVRAFEAYWALGATLVGYGDVHGLEEGRIQRKSPLQWAVSARDWAFGSQVLDLRASGRMALADFERELWARMLP